MPVGSRSGTMFSTPFSASRTGSPAFKIEPLTLMREGLRVVRPGGKAFFSSYADRFWKDRLKWFRLQAAAGLIGEIDEERTGDSIIVCKDGFTARTFRPADFQSLAGRLGIDVRIRNRRIERVLHACK
jgi:2-polyprenyl-6-hydroxyphenyl methylase/3-demethylubiquinone-9 3-methyltransferase